MQGQVQTLGKKFIPKLPLLVCFFLLAASVSVPLFYATNLPSDGSGAMDSVALWVAPDPNQSILFITDKSRDVVEMHDPVTNTFIARLGSSGNGPGQFSRPNGIAVEYNIQTGSGISDVVFVVERDNRRVSMFSLPAQNFLGHFGPNEMGEPYGIALHWNGSQLQAWITDNDGSTDNVYVYDIVASGAGLGGNFNFLFPTAGTLESAVVDPISQRILLCDEGAGNVMVYDLSGNFIQRFGQGHFSSDAEGIAIYDLGSGVGYIIVSDQFASPTEYEIFDRQNYQWLGHFNGPTTKTDGITLTQAPLPNLPNGSFYAVNSDENVHVYDWADIASALGLEIVVIGTDPPQPGITVTSPSSGEIWESGSSQTINWTNINFSDPVMIEYSIDGGSNWNLIANNVSNSGVYAWTVVDALTSQAQIRVSDAADGDPTDVSEDFIISNIPIVTADIKIWLQGPFINSSTGMDTTLKDNAVLPLTQPYGTAPWNYTGTESVAAIPADVMDWVLVELWSAASSASNVASRAVFIKSDGSIVDLDGSSPVAFSNIVDGDYHIVVHHRNHLAIMSANKVSLSGENTSYDFTTGSDKFFGNAGATELEMDVWGMWSGDIDQDGVITTRDYTRWFNSERAGDSGYQATDMNLDTQVGNSDYDSWLGNSRAGAASAVP